MKKEQETNKQYMLVYGNELLSFIQCELPEFAYYGVNTSYNEYIYFNDIESVNEYIHIFATPDGGTRDDSNILKYSIIEKGDIYHKLYINLTNINDDDILYQNKKIVMVKSGVEVQEIEFDGDDDEYYEDLEVHRKPQYCRMISTKEMLTIKKKDMKIIPQSNFPTNIDEDEFSIKFHYKNELCYYYDDIMYAAVIDGVALSEKNDTYIPIFYSKLAGMLYMKKNHPKIKDFKFCNVWSSHPDDDYLSLDIRLKKYSLNKFIKS